MFSRKVLSIWVTAVLEVRAALTDVTLVPPSGNISLNGPLWASGESGCGDLSSAGNHHSFDFTASISVVFQGIAVYFVGMNYDPEGSIMYQASLDGVPDIQFPSYIPPQANDCGVILYSKTGIANTKHTLDIPHVPGTPHDTSLGMVGFSVTTDDGSGIPLVYRHHRLCYWLAWHPRIVLEPGRLIRFLCFIHFPLLVQPGKLEPSRLVQSKQTGFLSIPHLRHLVTSRKLTDLRDFDENL
ncbi:hypothetical protein B0H16DRAFT_1597678 [Mycena metata]|uniref:Uncharacterized protein n=1 Tax=Mycena metata TaxID=1033252 RepID=A0AAD7HNC1_9AGAR|nr:hypothetical protein B0H16DRAFT_1597678 [Mycena metata]